MDRELFRLLTLVWLSLGCLIFVVLSFIPAPYGRYANTHGKLTIRTDLGWILMESPAVVVFTAVFFANGPHTGILSYVWIAMWMAHYGQRALIYPLISQSRRRVMPLLIVLGGAVFNIINAYLNAAQLYRFAPQVPTAWLLDTRFIVGMLIFAFGYGINRHSDSILRLLRRQSPAAYGVPQGGMFRWVSCPNYLGEIMIWCGWALATWTLPSLAFAVWTIANLAPRAGFHHRWYKATFSDYPESRKALIPRIW